MLKQALVENGLTGFVSEQPVSFCSVDEFHPRPGVTAEKNMYFCGWGLLACQSD